MCLEGSDLEGNSLPKKHSGEIIFVFLSKTVQNCWRPYEAEAEIVLFSEKLLQRLQEKGRRILPPDEIEGII